MKDWSAIMDWTPHVDHKGEYLQLWNNHNLDKARVSMLTFYLHARKI